MNALPTFMCLSLLATVWTSVAPAASGPQGDHPVYVPFTLEDNRAFVPVAVDGRGPFGFIPDTGSAGTTIADNMVGALQLRVMSTGTSDGAGEARVVDRRVSVRSLKVGATELGPLEVDAISYDLLRRAIGFRRVDGVLGTELFKAYAVTFDFDRSRLALERPADFEPPAGAVAIPFTLNDADMPVVDAAVNGMTGRFEVDTGDRSAVTVFGPFWRAHRLDEAMSPTVTAMTGYGVGGPIRSIVGRMPRFAIGGLPLPPPVTRLSLQISGAFASVDYAGSIGIGVLKDFTVTFDYATKTLYLARRARAGQRDGYDRSGMWLGLDPRDRVVIMDLVADGPAARAGLKIGDVVLAVGRRPASPGGIFALRRALQDRAAASATVLTAGATPTSHVVVLQDLIAPERPPDQ